MEQEFSPNVRNASGDISYAPVVIETKFMNSERKRRKSQRTSATFTFSSVLKAHGGLKGGTTYYIEANYGGLRKQLNRHCGMLGSKTSKKDKGWLVTPIADIEVPRAPATITIPASMETRKTIGEAAAYLRTRPAGAQCGLTGGPKDRKHLHGEFRQRGVHVSYTGLHGNRIITLVKLDEARPKRIKAYIASKRTSDRYLIGTIRKKCGLPANTPFYVQGNRTTLVRQLLKYVGPNNYSAKLVRDDPRGPGWIVTVKIAVNPV